jgi:potassium/hydrogen antiporter
MSVGLAIGVVGGFALNWVTQRLPLPNDGLYSLRSVAFVLVIFATSVLAHGSGFLAVFVAGIAVGDARTPFHREVAQFQSAVASLSEVVAFVVLGLTVNLADLARPDVWIPGLITAIVLTFVVRPLLCAGCLFRSHLRRGESLFVLFAGLKGAVPILLGSLLLTSQIAHARRLYAIVVVVVVFSVVVQGGLVPVLARRLRVPMRTVPSKPWALGVRLRDDPTGAQHLTVAAGSRVDGRTIGELHDLEDLPGDTWVSFIVRSGALLQVTETTVLQPGDEALVLASPESSDELRAAFGS